MMYATELTLATLLGLLHRLDDTDGNGLPHVTDCETTKWWILRVRLHTHWLAGDKLDDASITRLDELGGLLDGFACSAVNLLDKLREFTSNVGGVAIKDRSVSSTNLTRVVEDDNLSIEGCSLFGRVILRVGSNITAADILNRHVPKIMMIKSYTLW
jgi:hypothetical protein